MINDIVDNLKAEIEETEEALQTEFARVRTGRASPGLLDGVFAEYYGAKTALNQMATVNAPEARLIVVTPFDAKAIGAIEKAIKIADLGLNPINDGKLIRIPIPELTEERRKDLVRRVKKVTEEYRISIRSHRRDANEMVKDLLKQKEIAEDDSRMAQDKIQKLTDAGIARVDQALKAKEAEIMEV
ncbi:MAG: ribosome recycling factor [Deltaproteobacteria bacterium]